ncbi:pentatricopeptide repeat-containing protein At5g67570, chloroplastic isoform X2 [Andrographis paniculata]|uniref:pentatricopeptide repeat-containing protein At5g67570, chloroplastic isoform X2 n=1 Tax=Andrographis paniculata TaxID=175694 RepID=UPI0021E9AD6D|nr:pentatricopeptide repeat-containing protein At5g67570, chloroplastic isoform X2 [Andrographis paniculata]
MEASTGPLSLPNPPPPQPNLESIKRKLQQHGVNPTPRILHNIRKKELQKHNRRVAKRNSKQPPQLSDAQKQALDEESHFQLIKYEYKKFAKTVGSGGCEKLVGRPWEGLEKFQLRKLASDNSEYDGEKLIPERLKELSDIIECERDKFSWLVDDDIEIGEDWLENDGKRWNRPKRSESEAIKLLVDRLSAAELTARNWKFVRMMRYSGLQYTEWQMLNIVQSLGSRGRWRDALSVVDWVYSSKEHKYYKSRFVYTKLLTVLGRARKPREALRVFNSMRDAYIYPDMAAYHSLAVTLGQAGLLKELLNVVESMKEKPKKLRHMKGKNWSPELQPDIVVFNAVLNACVSTCQWKGVSWVFQELRKYGLRPNGASYGLAMEVMLKCGKYDLVHEFFEKMKRRGEALKALSYKVLVRAFWEEGKVDEAVEAVRDMERRGVIGTASVYYELARCLCFYGRSQDAVLEIERMRNLHPTRPLAVAFTGMIKSSMDGGHVHDCVSLYEHSKTLSAPDIGLVNAMLKVYGRNDLFHRARELFEETRRNGSDPKPDAYTFTSILEASAGAHQWEYFEHVYKEMTLSGFQVDQRKHSTLLVEASRAGKSHLLEHAFDSILDAGEVPPESFFTEMTCQAIIRRDYDRATNIINTMALAPFQVSLQQWISLFESNRDRIEPASLCELCEKITSDELSREATVVNLSRSLEIICKCDDHESLNSASSHGCDSANEPSNNRAEEEATGSLIDDENVRGWCEQFDNVLATSKGSSPYFDDFFESDDDSDGGEPNLEQIIATNEMDEGSESDTPSAYEILQIWKHN